MHRRNFIKAGTLGIMTMQLKDLNNTFTEEQEVVQPAMFVGHGNPMNAIEDNAFSKSWAEQGKLVPVPKAILCVSAHWLTRGTRVAAIEKPPTIHDFGGFPQALFDVQYPAPGSPEMARLTKELITKTQVELDVEWGLDHGCWSVLNKMFPAADIPVYQLSIDYYQTPQYHYELAQFLKSLRKKGVMIMGSGNIVHNLGLFNMTDTAYDWAIEFDAKIKGFIEKVDHQSILDYKSLGQSATLSMPTPDHYFPLIYALGVMESTEHVRFFNEKTTAGSISMRSFVTTT